MMSLLWRYESTDVAGTKKRKDLVQCLQGVWYGEVHRTDFSIALCAWPSRARCCFRSARDGFDRNQSEVVPMSIVVPLALVASRGEGFYDRGSP